MTSLDTAKLSASSEGPDDLAVQRGASTPPDAPPAGASAAETPSAKGDAGLHLQNAHLGTLEVRETNTAPAADGSFQLPAAQQESDLSERPAAARSQSAMPDATALANTQQGAEAPALAPVPMNGRVSAAESERFSFDGLQAQATVPATPKIVAPDQPAFKEDENGAPTDIDLSNTAVSENAAGAVIGSLTAIDPDAGDTFRFTVSDDRFEVVDGQLKLKDGISLDHEGEPSLTVSVSATDSAGHTFTESFTINVLNVNETPTDIALSNGTVAENAAGAVVGTLSTLDPDAGDTHQYAVSDNRFEVVDGQLKLKDGVALDHEAEATVTIQVTSTDAGGLSRSESFTITVQDANERPTDISLSNAAVAENAAGAVIGTLTSVDPDVGDSHTYTVSDNRFEVVDGQLKLKDGISLDHEVEPSVTLQVTTTDAGRLSFNETFTVTVDNVNESPADIVLSNTNVAENTAGAVIGTLTTVDPDTGDSHSYMVSDARFEVVGGQLKLKDGIALDHEGEPSVTIQVTTTDAGGLTYSENFSITVDNVNEAPTDIALSTANVAENAAGAVIGTLSTVDPDAGDNHTYTVSDSRFEVIAGQLKLKDGVSLDYEAEPSVSIQVTTTDAGGLSYSENFAITVENVNETPTDIALSSTTVAENAAGAVIGTLSTVDPDAGDSHSYAVSDNRFEVVGGQLKLKDGVSLDYEAEPSVSIQVTTTDAGGLTYSENFAITVENVNEVPTDIALSNASVAENAAGAVIGDLSTVDPDAGDSHTYTVSDSRFEVIGGQLKLKDGVSLDYEAEPAVSVQITTTDAGGLSYSENFTIAVENVNERPTDIALSNTTLSENAAGAVIGTLTTVDPDAGDSHTYTVSDARFEVVDGQLKLKDGISLDYEAEPSVTVQVTATDAGGLSYSENFSITVENVNETPTDIALSNATVAENAAGAVIGTLSTVDPDAGDSHTYTVSDSRFEIVDGQLKLKDGTSLDHEAEPSVAIQVTTTDAGGLTYSENFTVTVENVNETPTDIVLSNASVAENAAGAVIGTLTATDPDAGDSHSYAVSDNRFEVVDGQLKLKDGVSLDHETEPSVTIQVTATDAGGLAYSENFAIAVDDVNETPTDIALSNTSVAENAAGAIVGTLSTVDPDAGDSHSYTVSDNRFEVVDGQLKLRDGIALNRETESSVTVQVATTDAGGLSYSEDFTITVANVNEGPTDIVLSNTTVAENAAGAVVGTLTTADPDGGDTQTYSVSDSRFEVIGGQLKLKAGIALDHEAEPSVTIQVATTDAGGLSYSENFTITVANVNESPTDIALSNATVSENAAGAVIGTLSTVDPDAGDSHTYTVSDSRFEVIGGQLKLKAGIALDREAEPTVTIQVATTDAGGLSYNENFTITVANVNETPTDIALSNSNVAENAAGAVVGTLSTVDPDAGDSHTYTVSDSRFQVVGGQLKLKAGISLDRETEPTVTLQVATTDAGGLSYSENFTITVGNVNEAPTGIALSNSAVAENAAGAVIGNLSTTDPDAGDSFTYTVSDSRFQVVAGQLKLKAGVSLDYEVTPSVTLNVTATDAGGLSVTKSLTISVTDVAEVINGTSGNDTLNGTATADVINGLAGNDTINGNAGDDIIVGGVGNDTLNGGDGSDTYRYTTGDGFDKYQDNGTSGTDRIVATAANTAIGLQSGFAPAGGIEEISSGGFANVSIQGDTTNDTLNFSSTTLTGIVKIDGGSGNDTITGSAGDDTILGGIGNDILNGGGGNDTLEGGVGDDTLDGGAGSDTYVVGAGAGFDTYTDTGTSGVDTIVANAAGVAIGLRTGFAPASGIEAISANGFANVSIQGGTGADTWDFSATTLTGITKIDGGAGNDTITGSAGNDTIVGGLGNDTLRGGAGSDTYQVGVGDGVDTFSDTGTSGTDRIVATANDVAIGLASGFGSANGIEEINSGGFTNVSIVGGASGDTFDFSATSLTGIAKIDGGAGNDTITGSAGNDTIVGGLGNDTLRGGGGSDTYQVGVGDGVDTISDTGTSGTDRIVATANNVAIGLTSGFGPTNGIEEISANGFTNVSIIGGTGNDTYDFSATTLTGIAKIDGGTGTDTITGSAGNDTIVGGLGNDVLRGGGGSDTYQIGVGDGVDTITDTGTSGTDRIVATANDVAIGLTSGFGTANGIEEISAGGFANVSITGGTGADTLDFSATTLTGIARIDGGSGNDTITGSTGNDTIVGGVGDDSLRGGAGSDTYQVGTGHGFDAFADTGASGTDRIVATADGVTIGLQSGFGAASGIEEISNNGFANVSIAANTGNDTLNFSGTTLTGIVKIDGGNGNDTITGSGGNDTIYGGAGNDKLYGGNGNDTIVGGAGSDTLAGDAGIDTLSYAGSAAGVTVNLRTNAVSGGDAQGDTISGFENLTGSSFNDTFYGNSGANVMSGGDGNDVIHFGLTAGSDTAYGGAGTDFLQIDTAAGSAGWMQAIASGSTPTLASGDWLLQLDTGQTYVLHGSGATYDFGGVHAGVLTAADGSQMQFNEFEGVRW